MPEFVPVYDAKFGGPIRDNVKTLLENGEEDAFKWINGPDGMPETKVWRISHWLNTLFPCTSVILLRTNPDASADESRIDQEHLISVQVELDGPNPDDLVRHVEKRIVTYDQILRKAAKETPAAFFTGLVLNKAGALQLDISPHDYSYFGNENTNIYRTTVDFTVTIALMEIAHS